MPLGLEELIFFLLSIPFLFAFPLSVTFFIFIFHHSFFAAQCFCRDGYSLSRFRLTGPERQVQRSKGRPRCLDSPPCNSVMHSLKVLEKHLHLLLSLSSAIRSLNLPFLLAGCPCSVYGSPGGSLLPLLC